MKRVLLAILVSAGVVAGSVDTASARPAGPVSRKFEQGFAAFREALGDEAMIVRD